MKLYKFLFFGCFYFVFYSNQAFAQPPNFVIIVVDDQGWTGSSVQMDAVISGSKIYLPSADLKVLENGSKIRLKNLCNVILQDKNLVFSDFEHQKGIPIFQWCSSHKHIDLYYPDGKVVSGLVEDSIFSLDGHVVQFERTGFVKLEGEKAFFLHR